MKTIISIPFKSLRNDEHIFFHTEVLKVFTVEVATKYGIGQQRSVYNAAFESEQSGYKAKRSYASTEQIADADKGRDDVDQYLKGDIENKRRSPIPEVRSAANTLWHEVLPYVDSHRLNYDANTAQVTKLISVLRQPENAALVEQLGLTEIVNMLETANNTFLDLYSSRSEEEFERVNQTKMVTSRPITDNGYNQAMDAIVTLYKANELVAKDETTREELGGLIDDINTIINHRKTVLAARGEGGSSEDGGSTPDEGGTTLDEGGTTPDEGGTTPDEGGETPTPTPDEGGGTDNGGETPDPTPTPDPDDDEEVVG